MYLFLENALKWVFCEAKKIYLEMLLKPGLQKEDEQQPPDCHLFNPHEGNVSFYWSKNVIGYSALTFTLEGDL